MRLAGYAVTEAEMARVGETDEFDPETLHVLGSALDEAWRRWNSRLRRRS
jgi:hypothetical protein